MDENSTAKTKLNLQEIHKAFSSLEFNTAFSSLSSSTTTMPDHDQTDQEVSFEDELQAIETSTRPHNLRSIEILRDHVINAAKLANDDAQKWKLLVLTILRKRYHRKAPEAKSSKQKNNGKDRAGAVNIEESLGHGERMSFYISFLTLYYLSINESDKIPDNVKESSTKACTCLGRLALSAGGTRDLCTLIEHLVYVSLLQSGLIDVHIDQGKKRAVSGATVKTLQSATTSTSTSSLLSSTILDQLIKDAAELLDKDFKLIQIMADIKAAGGDQSSAEKDIGIQSTINTFIPHHDRGTDVRKLTQTVAELMIWNATTHSSTDQKFTDAVQAISSISLPSSSTIMTDSSAVEKVIFSLHAIQTSIRRFRKILNESSRRQGFSLCSSYSIDPSSITLSMVKRGREGDVTSLQKVARRKLDQNIMKLLANRSTDPSKAIPIDSIRRFSNSWIPLDAGDKGDELLTLQLQIQEATVIATIKLLQEKVQWKPDFNVVLASIDGKVECDCAVILIACAFNPWDDGSEVKEENGVSGKVKMSLFIDGKECKITSKDDAMFLLNEVCARDTTAESSSSRGAPATTKDVQNFIERHVEPNSHLILMTSTDVKIEQRVLTDLQTNKNTIHCHMMDDFTYRMNREKAKVGDVTITLTWDDESDLDLHCICPNGDHIYYGEREGGEVIGGGYLDVDMNAGYPYSKEPVENIFFGDAEKGIEAAKGNYKVFVQNYAYHGEVKHGSAIPWRVRVVKNGEIQNYSGECKGTGKSSDVTVVEFEYNGRVAPPPEKIGSALDSSNLVSVTSSTGDTMDSISGLLSVVTEHKELAMVEELVRTETEDGTIENRGENGVQIHQLMADEKTFHITNRDRLYLNLSKLPKLFHTVVNQCFSESVSLLDFTASNLAQRLITDKVPIEALKQAGYQDDITFIVKEKMKTFGI